MLILLWALPLQTHHMFILLQGQSCSPGVLSTLMSDHNKMALFNTGPWQVEAVTGDRVVLDKLNLGDLKNVIHSLQ